MTRAGSADTRRLFRWLKRDRPPAPVSDFTPWAGQWVAVKHGAVMASSPDLRDLVPLLQAMGKRAHGALAHHVPGVSS